mmetsp:Transcript_7831/g.9507  ORF Transcript_7831/g.9507 Transcript_7831/m.9507 type:complete len:172 (-) Transcript_7831:199-714(-)
MFRRIPNITRRMAQRAANWEYLSSTIGKNVDIEAFRTVTEEMEEAIVKAPKSVKPIDFKAWEAKVGKEAVAVAKAGWEKWVKEEKSAKMISFSDDQVKSLKSEAADMIAAAQTMEDWHKLRLRELEIEIAKLTHEKDNIDNLSTADLMKRYPHIEKRVEEELEQGVWPGSI